MVDLFAKGVYRKLMVFPALVLLISLVLFYSMYSTGLKLDVDLAGGTQISIASDRSINEDSLQGVLKDFDATVHQSRGVTGYSILIKYKHDVNTTEVLDVMKTNGYSFEDYSVQTVGPSLGSSFFAQAQMALILAFVFMAITVFIVFRQPMPSFYVVLCAFSDLIETIVVSQLLGIELSLATFAALLLTIGYSVDTDILLTTRVLRSAEGTTEERMKGAFKTGMTMVGTTMAAVLALYLMSTSVVITQMASILLIALFFDIFNTWITNAGLLHWYLDKKGKA